MVDLKIGKNKFLFILFLFTIISLFTRPVRADDAWGFQISDFIIKKKLNDKFALKFHYNFNAKEDKRPAYFSYYRLGVAYSPYDWLEVTPAYQYTHCKQDSGDWDHKNRLLLGAKFKWKAQGLKFSNRNRFELKSFDVRPDHVFRYRNKLTISKSIKLGTMKFSPFISEEIFYDLTDHSADINEFTVGVSKWLGKNHLLKVFYRLQSVKKGKDWSETNFIGTSIILFY